MEGVRRVGARARGGGEGLIMPKRKRSASADELMAEPPKGYWLIKSEPSDYSFEDMERDGETAWDGVRNALAQKHLRAMNVGDRCLFYHSSCGKHTGVVGTVRVSRAAYPDPNDGRYAVVDVKYESPLQALIPLTELKKCAHKLVGLALFAMPRLSVMPVTQAHAGEIFAVGGPPTSTTRTASAPAARQR